MNWAMWGALGIIIPAVLAGAWWLSHNTAKGVLQQFEIRILTDTPTERSPIRGIVDSALLQFKVDLVRELDGTFIRERECDRRCGELTGRVET
ncbi:MAG: hypothetical protein MUO70_05200, partial [Euryarchaeota archaeon]|nr:hypothetical protein [Euryarchaeota archaeon]